MFTCEVLLLISTVVNKKLGTGNRMQGWTGKLLEIDLRAKTTKITTIKSRILENYIGGKGLGAYLLYKGLPPKVNPLGPENLLIFSTGPLSGLVPTAGRFATVTKSPLTGLFLDSYCGGFLAAYTKQAGFDAVLVKGKSEKPLYLWVADETVEFRDAEDLWGLDTYRTVEEVQKRTDGKASVVAVGPAGENLVRFAVVTSEKRDYSGRGGSGAVMGSKNLKAIAVRGSKQIDASKPKEMRELSARLSKEAVKKAERFVKYGTTTAVTFSNEIGMLPTRNFQTTSFEGADNLSGEKMKKYRIKDGTCFGCPIRCIKINRVPSSKNEEESTSIQYEGMAMLGPNCGIADLKAMMRAYLLANKLGLDVISGGDTVAFAMECFERGIIDEKNVGYALRFGDGEAQRRLLEDIAYRRGIGDLLAQGVKHVSEKLGAQDFAVHVKGMDLPAWEPRGRLGLGVSYATAEIGASHLRGWPATREMPVREALDTVKSMIKSRDKKIIEDSSVVCTFFPFSLRSLAQLITLATGKKMTASKLKKAAWRIDTTTRMFNLREGATKRDDILPPRLMKEPVPSGPAKGHKAFTSKRDFKQCLDRYYELRGWNREGEPTLQTIERLGIERLLKQE
jgi:aldehyde:ferredoxin oxidoreductase